MGFKCGIVGLPNVGKSTLFNSLTRGEIAAENYPFCTIDPNVGVVEVPDTRLQRLADIVNPKKIIATTMEFVDIAGLVEGASKGEGLGNQFLANIRETDAIAHVVRCFDNDDVVHVAGRLDPLADIEVINTELSLADLESVERAMERTEKRIKANDKSEYGQAKFLDPSFVARDVFQIAFLRASDYRPAEAAAKIVEHFKAKLELFGLGLLVKDITTEDLKQSDQVLLSSGRIQIVGYDQSGRDILFISQGCGDYFDPSLSRAYVCKRCLSKDLAVRLIETDRRVG